MAWQYLEVCSEGTSRLHNRLLSRHIHLPIRTHSHWGTPTVSSYKQFLSFIFLFPIHLIDDKFSWSLKSKCFSRLSKCLMLLIVVFSAWDNITALFDQKLDYIPLTFMLGFYVTIIVGRWSDIFINVGWIDKWAHLVLVLIFFTLFMRIIVETIGILLILRV